MKLAGLAAALLATVLSCTQGVQHLSAANMRLGPPAELQEAARLYDSILTARAPGLVAPPIDFLAGAPEPAGCASGTTPRTFAVLVGATDIGIPKLRLKGPENDIALLATAFRDRGAAPDRVVMLANSDATRERVIDAFRKVIAKVRCDDRVVVQFSGHGVSSRGAVEGILQKQKAHATEAEWSSFLQPEAREAYLAKLEAFVTSRNAPGIDSDFNDRVARLQLAREDDLMLMLWDQSEEDHEVFRGRDVSDAITAIRNRGAHAIVVLDAPYAGLAAIESRQRAADEVANWSYEYSYEKGEGAKDYWASTPLTSNAGDFAIFYAAGGKEVTPEMPVPSGAPPEQQKRYGLFSYSLAGELLQNPFATPRSIASAIDASYRTSGRTRPSPRIFASDPDLVLVAEQQPAREDPIRILKPAQTRGAAAMPSADIEIEGIVDWPVRLLGVHVDNQEAAIDERGRFRSSVRLKSGMNAISVIAVTADSRMFQKTLELVFEGDREALEGSGKRYAVIIANEKYGPATGMATLSTPLADARALTALLVGKYGFETEIKTADRTVPLLLQDPTKRDIEFALHQVGKVVGSKDTVLIFYAGHGVFEKATSNAYWIPSDAEQGFEPSYLSAADISAAIQRMQAGSVILVSDSCYSGGLLRGEPAAPEKIPEKERVEALLKLQSGRSRIVISSGNNEPVTDVGGKGHSIFAEALLTGLEEMEYDAFSARELFDRFILQQVTANSDQEPQYRPLEKVGHEGGDFVFVRIE